MPPISDVNGKITPLLIASVIYYANENRSKSTKTSLSIIYFQTELVFSTCKGIGDI